MPARRAPVISLAGMCLALVGVGRRHEADDFDPADIAGRDGQCLGARRWSAQRCCDRENGEYHGRNPVPVERNYQPGISRRASAMLDNPVHAEAALSPSVPKHEPQAPRRSDVANPAMGRI